MIKKYTLRFPEELQREIKKNAKNESRSLHSHIIYILREWIKNKKAADTSSNYPAALNSVIMKGKQS